MPEPHYLISVFVGYIVAAAVRYLSVDDGYLAVRAVVEPHIEGERYLIERVYAHAAGFEFFYGLARQGEHAPDVVVYEPHVHARGGALDKRGFYLVPYDPAVDDEVFHEHELFRRLYVLDEVGEKLVAERIVLGRGVAVHRVGRRVEHEVGERSSRRVKRRSGIEQSRVGHVEQRLRCVRCFFEPLAHAARRVLSADEDIQQTAEYGQCEYEHAP